MSIAGNNQNFVSKAAGANNLGVVDTGSATIVGSSAAIASIYALVPTYKLKSNSYRGTCGTFPDLHFTFQGSANTYTVSGNLLEVKTAVGDCIALINGIANCELSFSHSRRFAYNRSCCSPSKHLVAWCPVPS